MFVLAFYIIKYCSSSFFLNQFTFEPLIKSWTVYVFITNTYLHQKSFEFGNFSSYETTINWLSDAGMPQSLAQWYHAIMPASLARCYQYYQEVGSALSLMSGRSAQRCQ
jgi:hypothetical protein